MAKAKKAPQKAQTTQKKETRWIGAVVFILGALVVLSMLLSSVFTRNPQVQVQPTAFPTAMSTSAP